MDKQASSGLRFKQSAGRNLKPRHNHHHYHNDHYNRRHHHYDDQNQQHHKHPGNSDVKDSKGPQLKLESVESTITHGNDKSESGNKDILADYAEKFDIIEAPDFVPSDDESLINTHTINRIKSKNGHINLLVGTSTHSGTHKRGFEETEREGNQKSNATDHSRMRKQGGSSALDVNYSFGDKGSHWRMMKLEKILEAGRSSGRSMEGEAMERYGDLVLFYIAMEEREELQRRKEIRDKSRWVFKPTGWIARKHGLLVDRLSAKDSDRNERGEIEKKQVDEAQIQMMKAKIRKLPDFKEKETQYKKLRREYDETVRGKSLSTGSHKQPELPEPQKLTEDEMSIEQLAKREHLMSSEQVMKATVKQLASLKSFDNRDLDSQDEMASRLASLEQEKSSKNNLKALKMLITNPKLAKAMQHCSYCLTNTRNHPPVVKSTRSFYLSLMPRPEITQSGCMIIPYEHIRNSLELDADQRDELKDIMTELSLFYFKKWQKNVIFYENSVLETNHLTLKVVPLPLSYKPDVVKTYFVNGILEHYDEAKSSQHKPIIDTMSAGGARYDSLIAKNAPFFHVWLTAEGGIGHIIEDSSWPRGDLFAREIIGGMLDVNEFIIHSKLRFIRNDDLIKELRLGLGDKDEKGEN